MKQDRLIPIMVLVIILSLVPIGSGSAKAGIPATLMHVEIFEISTLYHYIRVYACEADICSPLLVYINENTRIMIKGESIGLEALVPRQWITLQYWAGIPGEIIASLIVVTGQTLP